MTNKAAVFEPQPFWDFINSNNESEDFVSFFSVFKKPSYEAKLESFQGGDTLELLVGGLGSLGSKLVILDSSNRLDIVLFYYVAIGDTAYEIRLRSSTTGSKQAGLEFEGKETIGNIVEDPIGVKAKIEKLFLQRSSMR